MRAMEHVMGRVRMVMMCMGVLIGASGCGGCEGDQQNTEPGICPEVPCRGTQRCVEGVCLGLTDVICLPGCGDGEICQLGECIQGVEVCAQAGETCDVRMPVSGDFYCIDWDGFTTGDAAVCSSPCASDGSCDEGEACFILSGLDDSACTSDATCSAGTTCLQGMCQAAACQPSECEGFLDGIQTCERKYAGGPDFPQGASCQELPDGTNFCFAAGQGARGDRCRDFIDAFRDDQLDATCNVGLACVQGICRDACSDENACEDEDSGTECLFAEEDFVASGVGFCGRVCTPFSTGECGEQGKCLPLDAQRGYCVPAGDVEAFEMCEPGAWQCIEGSSCVALTPTDGRCMPLCNVTVAPMDPTAPVTERDQLLRDETCPQVEDVAVSYVRVSHMALEAGAYDVYLDRGATPWVQGLAPASFEQGMQGYLPVTPGTHLLEFFPAGGESTEEPVADITVSIARDEITEVVVATSAPLSADEVALYKRQAPEAAGSTVRRLWHIGPDLGGVTFIVRDAQGMETRREATLFLNGTIELELPAESEQLVALVAAGAPQQRVIWEGTLDVQTPELLYLTGTLEPDDFADVKVEALALAPRPERQPPPPRMLCNDLNNGAFGYCQQACRGAVDYGDSDVCEGDSMGCYPVRLPGLTGFRSLCQPEGGVEEAGRCDPVALLSDCASGFYCQEYGNGDPGVSAGTERGVCTRLCGTDEMSSGDLICASGQICQPIDVTSLDVGRCGQPCTPSGMYSDMTCPEGLRHCKPSAVLEEDTTGSGDSAPVVVELESVCSASGVIPEGESCPGVDCAPGSECIFPRSAQQDLVSTLLSPYFGGAGLAPTCRAYCDPFDALRTSRRCGVGETCLVNFPWSADVGHCATVVEDVQPFQACSRPGESCGDDSVCVIDGGAPFCLRLCEYTGGRSAMTFDQSTCPAGLQCGPLVNDVGFCQ